MEEGVALGGAGVLIFTLNLLAHEFFVQGFDCVWNPGLPFTYHVHFSESPFSDQFYNRKILIKRGKNAPHGYHIFPFLHLWIIFDEKVHELAVPGYSDAVLLGIVLFEANVFKNCQTHFKFTRDYVGFDHVFLIKEGISLDHESYFLRRFLVFIRFEENIGYIWGYFRSLILINWRFFPYQFLTLKIG